MRDPVKTICYGKEKIWDDRQEAMAFFLEAMSATEGSEQARYTSIYLQLQEGNAVCSDAEV